MLQFPALNIPSLRFGNSHVPDSEDMNHMICADVSGTAAPGASTEVEVVEERAMYIERAISTTNGGSTEDIFGFYQKQSCTEVRNSDFLDQQDHITHDWVRCNTWKRDVSEHYLSHFSHCSTPRGRWIVSGPKLQYGLNVHATWFDSELSRNDTFPDHVHPLHPAVMREVHATMRTKDDGRTEAVKEKMSTIQRLKQGFNHGYLVHVNDLENQTRSGIASQSELERDHLDQSLQFRIGMANATRCTDVVSLDEPQTAILLWCSVTGLVVFLVMSLAFCCYYRQQKQRWEIERLRKLLNKNDPKKADIIIEAHRRNSLMIIEGMPQDMSHHPPHAISPRLNQRRQLKGMETACAAEPFENLVENMHGVQEVLMDDIVGEMATEGGRVDHSEHELSSDSDVPDEGRAMTIVDESALEDIV